MTTGGDASPVRLRDVAVAAGVNPSIASRILNDDPTLSARPETRRRVRSAAQQLGYTPNAFARGLKRRRTTTLGLVLSNVAAAANQDLIVGAERRAAASGYVVLLADTEDVGRGDDLHRRLVLERRVDGLVIGSTATDDRLIRELDQHGLPYVLVNQRGASGGLRVTAGDGLEIAVRHLVALGHERVALVTEPASDGAARRRLEELRAAATRCGARLHAVVGEGDLTEDGGFRAATSLLDTPSPPTALIAEDVAQCIGAGAAVRERGLVVPRHVSLVALKDAAVAAYLDPPLTAIRMPVREIAETAVEILIALVEGATAADTVVSTPPEIVVRGSTAPPIGVT